MKKMSWDAPKLDVCEKMQKVLQGKRLTRKIKCHSSASVQNPISLSTSKLNLLFLMVS